MSLRPRPTRLPLLLVLLVVAVVTPGAVLLVPPAGAAPPTAAPDLDHFRCYSVTVGHPPGLAVTLEDQFDVRLDQVEDVFVGFPIGFCNPVKKTVEGPGGKSSDILDPRAHLTLYEIHESTALRHPTWKVTVDNQFGRQTLFAGKPVLLGVPTRKLSVDGVETGLGAPEGLDHFKCYVATGRKLELTVTLADQFETALVIVVEPRFFCNPVTKTVGDTITPIGDAEAHLACYSIELAAPAGFIVPIPIETANQFSHVEREPMTVLSDERVLCVPSAKSAALAIPGSFKLKTR